MKDAFEKSVVAIDTLFKGNGARQFDSYRGIARIFPSIKSFPRNQSTSFPSRTTQTMIKKLKFIETVPEIITFMLRIN